jgi:multidrug efflux pump
MILLVTPVWLLVPYRVGRWGRRMRDRALRRKPADAVYGMSDDHKQEDRDRILPAAE